MTEFSYSLVATDEAARLGSIQTAHGVIDTPAFMPVGTAGTVKAMMPSSVIKTGSQVVLGNTYHLMLRPGADRIARLGGLHNFMNWKGQGLTKKDHKIEKVKLEQETDLKELEHIIFPKEELLIIE